MERSIATDEIAARLTTAVADYFVQADERPVPVSATLQQRLAGLHRVANAKL